ncbi:MAG: cytochrome c [Alphaproteobacteria bacterium]
MPRIVITAVIAAAAGALVMWLVLSQTGDHGPMMADDAMDNGETMASDGTMASDDAMSSDSMSDDAMMAAGLDMDADDVIAARRAIMRSVGAHTGLLSAVAKGELAFGAHVTNSAKALQALANGYGHLFPAGTGAADGDTNALDVIWDNMADFDSKLSDMQMAAANLADATDAAGVGAGMQALGGSCQACHQTYRKPLN